jgi:NAD(P)-dependent dehydrogenase (short-subunit alcohol dehydrogenase family)
VAGKHAGIGLMRATAAEVAGTGVTANAVCPGYVDTPMTDNAVSSIASTTGRGEEAARSYLEKTSPLGRLITADEVAAAVAYLASPEAAAVNGQTLGLYGGGIFG